MLSPHRPRSAWDCGRCRTTRPRIWFRGHRPRLPPPRLRLRLRQRDARSVTASAPHLFGSVSARGSVGHIEAVEHLPRSQARPARVRAQPARPRARLPRSLPDSLPDRPGVRPVRDALPAGMVPRPGRAEAGDEVRASAARGDVGRRWKNSSTRVWCGTSASAITAPRSFATCSPTPASARPCSRSNCTPS